MKEEILPINLLRFLAALAVLCVHKLATLLEIGYLPNFFTILVPFVSYGYLGVNLFFLISGFVITLSSDGRTLGQFLSARFIRLYPVFWICLSITSLAAILLGSEHIPLGQYLANLTMIPQEYGVYDFIDGSYWTLGIELRFYFFVAFILLLRPLVNISLEKLALILSLPLLYIAIFFNPYSISFIDSFLLTIFYYFGSEYAQYFLAGILFYGVYKNPHSYYYYVGICSYYVVALLRVLDQAYPSDKPLMLALHVTLFFGMFLVISLKKITNSSLSFLGTHARTITITLGAITYPLYLLHSKIISLLMDTFTRLHLPPFLASPLLVLLVAGLVFAVNMLDKYLHTLWKKSSIVKTILERYNQKWLEKIF